jgi:RNA polymerase sigma factor (sigma-70 family)
MVWTTHGERARFPRLNALLSMTANLSDPAATGLLQPMNAAPDIRESQGSDIRRGLTGEQVRQLTAGVSRGEDAAFTRFHERYGLRLYKLLLYLTKGQEEDAREVWQAVMIKLTKRFEVFDDEGRLWSWLRQVAHHRFVDHCRAKRRTPFVPLEALAGLETEIESTESELSRVLKNAMKELAEEDQELLLAFYLDRRPLSELAAEAGQSYKAMESRLTRLRLKLKTHFLEHLKDEDAE